MSLSGTRMVGVDFATGLMRLKKQHWKDHAQFLLCYCKSKSLLFTKAKKSIFSSGKMPVSINFGANSETRSPKVTFGPSSNLGFVAVRHKKGRRRLCNKADETHKTALERSCVGSTLLF